MTARLAVAALVALLVFAPSAFAAPHHSLTSSFGASGTGGSQFGAGSPTGAAINQATGDVYVADTANARVERFQADGTFVSAWGWGVADGTAAAQVCTSSCQAGISGSGAGQLAAPAFVAVDNSTGFSGSGDVYVADTTNNTVIKFDAAGNYISTNGGFTATEGPFGALAGIAVNAAGELWVYDQNAEMFKFAQDGTFITDFNTSFGVAAVGIAVDGADNLYIVRGAPFVEKISDTGVDLGQVTADSGATGLTIDAATGELYVDQGTTIERFASSCDPSGGPCAISETFGSPDLTAGSGLAVRTSDSRAYVADPGNTQVDIFDFGDPAIATTSPATAVHHTSAVLNGHLDPGGDPGITNCQFDWIDDAQFQIDAFASAHTIDCAQGDTHTTAADVTAQIGNLTPGATYHYRLHITTTSNGDVTGSARTFTAAPFQVVHPTLSTFGPNGTSGSSFDRNDRLAFDQADQKLYALDQNALGIYGFDASAPPSFPALGGFAPHAIAAGAAGDSGLAVDNTALSSAGNIYYLPERGPIYGFNATGAPLGGNFPIDPSISPGAPAGDPNDICGAAVDSAGNLWVANYASQRILKYSSAGVYQSSVDTSILGGACHVAFSADDDLYVGLYQGATYRYTAASGYTSATQIDPGPTVAIAVDQATDHLYVAHIDNVTEHDPAGTSISDFATGIPGASFRGIAVDFTNHDVYVSDVGNGKIRAFGPGLLQTAPTVTPGAPSAITGTAVTLHAAVDPEGIAVTDCHFEYGIETAPGSTSPLAAPAFDYTGSAPCTPSAASIGGGSGDVPVSASISGLNPGSTYHFRIVAANATAGGTATGPDQTLGTPGAVVHDPSATKVSDTAAGLNAKVDPRGQSTTYRFQYVTDHDFRATGYAGAASAPATPSAIGAGNADVAVGERITGLAPATTYHFRILATNASGTTEGFDATFTTYATTPSTSDPCSNDALRSGPGARLPDCRAYEQASPTDKNGAGIEHSFRGVQAAAAGNRITFTDAGGLPSTGGSGSGGGLTIFAVSRGADAWSATNGLTAPTEPGLYSSLMGWDDEVSTSVSSAKHRVPGASGLYLRDSATGASRQAASLDSVNDSPALAGFAEDTAHLIVEAAGDATVPASILGRPNVYDLDHGAVTLASRIPSGTGATCDDSGHPGAIPCIPAPAGAFAGPYAWVGDDLGGPSTDRGGATQSYYTKNTISSDGSKVFFTASGSGQLYMREHGISTTQISASQASTPDPNGHKPAAFMGATPTGSKVFFTSCERLTDDSTAFSTTADSCTDTGGGVANVQGSDLYSYDTSSGDLTDLTVSADPANARSADVRGFLGTSDNGSDVYYVANGVLASGAAPGDCTVGGGGGSSGHCSLYLSHGDDAPVSIARLDASANGADWTPLGHPVHADAARSSRVAADGTLIFLSNNSLTGYDNTETTAATCGNDNNAGEGCQEVFRFARDGAGLSCLSCNPTGARPNKAGDAELWSEGNPIGSRSTFVTRNISADGNRVFFSTPEPLVPADTNGDAGCPRERNVAGLPVCMDAYEWEAAGSGSCHSSDVSGGCIYLLSTGKSSTPAVFGDASVSGDDVFIFTDEPLVPSDHDEFTDAYDVRVGGGFASQHQVVPPRCSDDTCQGLPSGSPSDPGAGSSSFSGPGNESKRPGGSATPAKARVKVLSKAVHGARFLLAVRVPGQGRVTVSGAGIRTVRRSLSKAGTAHLRVSLTTKQRTAFRHKHTLKLRLRVAFVPAHDPSSSVTVSVTVKA
jgi:hypothetical protein